MGTNDIKIQNRCDHKVIFERVRVDSDRVSMYPAYPVGSHKNLEMTRFGSVVPPNQYSFVLSRATVYEGDYYKIELKNPDMYNDPLYELSYNTPSRYCPKCLGTQFVDDMIFDDRNEVQQVTGAQLLIQEVEKAIVTTKNTNKYYPWVGTKLKKLVGSKIADFTVLAQEIQADVRNALENLKNQQRSHQGMNPTVTSDQVLNTVEVVDVTPHENDPSIVQVYVQYTSQSGEPYDITQLMSLTQYRLR